MIQSLAGDLRIMLRVTSYKTHMKITPTKKVLFNRKKKKKGKAIQNKRLMKEEIKLTPLHKRYSMT
jgi:hypothetical protein